MIEKSEVRAFHPGDKLYLLRSEAEEDVDRVKDFLAYENSVFVTGSVSLKPARVEQKSDERLVRLQTLLEQKKAELQKAREAYESKEKRLAELEVVILQQDKKIQDLSKSVRDTRVFFGAPVPVEKRFDFIPVAITLLVAIAGMLLFVAYRRQEPKPAASIKPVKRIAPVKIQQEQSDEFFGSLMEWVKALMRKDIVGRYVEVSEVDANTIEVVLPTSHARDNAVTLIKQNISYPLTVKTWHRGGPTCRSYGLTVIISRPKAHQAQAFAQ
jgi:hypothetical protein